MENPLKLQLQASKNSWLSKLRLQGNYRLEPVVSSHRYDVFEWDDTVGRRRTCGGSSSTVTAKDERRTVARGTAAVMLLLVAAAVGAVVEVVGGLVERPFPVDKHAVVFLHPLPLLVNVDPLERHSPDKGTVI